MSRLEQGIIQIRKEETDLLRTVKNVLGQIQSQAEEKQICFSYYISGKKRPLPMTVIGWGKQSVISWTMR